MLLGYIRWMRSDGDVSQSEETFPGKSLQHEDALLRKFQHLPEPGKSRKIDNAWDDFSGLSRELILLSEMKNFKLKFV